MIKTVIIGVLFFIMLGNYNLESLFIFFNKYLEVIKALSTIIGATGGIALLWKTFIEVKKSKSEIKDYLSKSKSELVLKKTEELPSLLLQLQHMIIEQNVKNLQFDEKSKYENKKNELEVKITTLLYAYSTLEAILLYTHLQKLLKTGENQIKCLTTFYVLLAQIRYDISNFKPDFSLFSITYPEYRNKIEEIKEYTLSL